MAIRKRAKLHDFVLEIETNRKEDAEKQLRKWIAREGYIVDTLTCNKKADGTFVCIAKTHREGFPLKRYIKG